MEKLSYLNSKISDLMLTKDYINEKSKEFENEKKSILSEICLISNSANDIENNEILLNTLKSMKNTIDNLTLNIEENSNPVKM